MASSRASWMYTDPYAYQYSAIDTEDDGSERDAAGSDLSELEGSTPTDTTRYELAASPLIKAARDSQRTPSEPSGLNRSRLTKSRSSVRYSDRRGHASAAPRTPKSPRHVYSDLIPVEESTHAPAQGQTQHYVPDTTTTTATASSSHHQRARPSPPTYEAGLIPLDENATTPKEPSSDFDAILRNIGPISKKGKGKISRERSSRYCDRYSSNFG
ncbi:hypothetical protein F4859DRAFT_510215 [Xylaria cf. heliscus]|nr:hypothetical protein F4859DRAFT_510215 [Xylaria cf. heliscus]